MPRCPRCSVELETPVGCLACGQVLPLGDEPDRLDPFEVLGLQPAFSLDAQDLRKRLLRFSRLVHPDFFATAGADEKRRAEKASAVLNAAHAILSDDLSRADHLVRMFGGPDENTEREMPKEFLMEVLEWNETLEEARAGSSVPADRLEALRSELETRRTEALEAVSRLLTPLPARGSATLVQARKELNAVRYVDRALGELEALRLARAESR